MRKPLPLLLQQELLRDELRNTPVRSPIHWFQLLESQYQWTWGDFQLYFTGEIYPNTYARFASLLSRYLNEGERTRKGDFSRHFQYVDEFGIEKYLRDFLGSLVASCVRLSTWDIQFTVVSASFFLPTINKLKVFWFKKFLFLLQPLGVLQV